jgi:hypothetical protein
MISDFTFCKKMASPFFSLFFIKVEFLITARFHAIGIEFFFSSVNNN